jgi:hypothetical protein
MTLYAVELKITHTFSSYLIADSQDQAEKELAARAKELHIRPDSVIVDACSYQMEKCQYCGEEHFGPACKPAAAPRMKSVGELLLQPSWERAQL